MRLATHAAFGAFLTLGVTSLTELEITPAALGLAVLSSTLPELDHEGSEIGSLFPFISRRLSRRFGHRTVTHSFVGLSAFGLMISPLWLFFPELWWACLLGYFSHILLDVFAPKGVLWFWPSLVPAGFGTARVKTGSAGESVMLVVFIALSFLIYPISNVGALGALRSAIGQIEMTFEEYRRLAGEGRQVYLSGSLQENRTKEILRGEWPIVDLAGEGYLIRVGEVLRSVGRSPEYDLYPLSVRVSSHSQEGLAKESGPSALSLVPLRFEVATAQELYIEEGQQIEQGQLLGLKQPDPAAETVEELLQSREVRSPLSGVIRRLTLSAQEKGLRVEALVEVLGKEAAPGPPGSTPVADGQEARSAAENSPENLPNTDEAKSGVMFGKSAPIEIYFSPGPEPEQALIKLMDQAQATIHIALYYFTDRELAQALVRAHERGVRIQVLLDEDQRTAEYSKSRYLQGKGLEVRFYGGSGYFHHKFMVIDSAVVATGSYNWTASAQSRNEENLLVIHDPLVAQVYLKEWQRLWEVSRP
jgi:membrane-bound metal-dependent hydrolase YbcI (DUF457 family)